MTVDPLDVLSAWTLQHDSRLTLISDSDRAISEAYDVVVERGERRSTRATYAINQGPVVEHVWWHPKPRGHAEDVLNWLRAR